MKTVLFIILIILPCWSFAQLSFILKGTGNAFNEGDKIYLAYKDNGKQMFDSATVTQHTFEFKGTIQSIAKGSLYKNENPMLLDIVKDVADLYIEPGIILIKSADSLHNAVLSGTPANSDLYELSVALKPLRLQANLLARNFDALQPEKQKDINTLAVFRAGIKNINKQMIPVQLAFVKGHPNSYISLVTLKQLVYTPELLLQIDSIYTGLAPALKSSTLGNELAQVIAASQKSASGLMALNFSLPDVKGKMVSLTNFKGKYVLIDFWASWCLPCRKENPNIMLAYNQYKNKGFTVLGVSIDNTNNKDAWLQAIKADGLTWPQVLDGKPDKEKIKTMYGITTIPANILVDPLGKIIAKNLTDKVLLNKLAELMPSK